MIARWLLIEKMLLIEIEKFYNDIDGPTVISTARFMLLRPRITVVQVSLYCAREAWLGPHIILILNLSRKYQFELDSVSLSY